MSEVTAHKNFVRGVAQPGDRIDRIENLVGLGFPDTNGCFNGVEFWMEIKAPLEPVRDRTPLFGSNHKLSQAQMNWFLKQRHAKGLGFVYIETDRRRLLLDGCLHGDQINSMTVMELVEHALWVSMRPTSPEDWLSLRQSIAHHG